ncbi:uncharacterized protein LOC123230180 [Mangifera indica]|uniref:uncharacterized protein LOC123230180 n=1 Tax=Mangifera indica TaxID=29780 RepID=UPI001CFB0ED5|nr:uncharacterized protein LOC123230180 [Mangifera indica]
MSMSMSMFLASRFFLLCMAVSLSVQAISKKNMPFLGERDRCKVQRLRKVELGRRTSLFHEEQARWKLGMGVPSLEKHVHQRTSKFCWNQQAMVENIFSSIHKVFRHNQNFVSGVSQAKRGSTGGPT